MKKIRNYILVVFLLLAFGIINVNAKSYAKDLFQAGDKITIKNKLEGTSFIAGNEINVNNTIDGIGFVAGNKLTFNADQEYVIGAGNEITIEKDIAKDLFLAANDIKVHGNVLRDSYLMANTITLDGNFTRNTYVYAAEVTLSGTFNGNISIRADKINIEGAKITGTLKYNEDATVLGLTNEIKTKTYKNDVEKITFKEYITTFILKYIHIVMLAIVLVFALEKLFKKSLEQTKDLNAKTVAILCGKGFLILIGVPIIALMLMFSSLFTSVGVIGGIVYGILVYIANIFSAYSITKILDEKLFKKNMNSYLLMIIGLFIIYVLSAIPYIGGFISFISLIFGLGIVGNMIIELKNN